MKEQHPTPLAGLQKVLGEYQKTRAELEEAVGQLQRLKKQRAVTQQSSQAAGEKWRQQFKASMGNPSKEVRALQSEEHAMKAEVEQLDELMGELDSRVAQLQQEAAELRQAHLDGLHLARQDAVDSAFERTAATLFRTEEARGFLGATEDKLAGIYHETVTDWSFMAQLGFGAHEIDKPGFVQGLSNQDRGAVEREVTRRKAATIADLVMRYLPGNGSTAFGGDLYAPLPPLDCEKALATR